MAAVLIVTLTIMVVSRHANAGTSEKMVAIVAPTNSSMIVPATNIPAMAVPVIASVPSKVTNGLVLHLEIITG